MFALLICIQLHFKHRHRNELGSGFENNSCFCGFCLSSCVNTALCCTLLLPLRVFFKDMASAAECGLAQ